MNGPSSNHPTTLLISNVVSLEDRRKQRSSTNAALGPAPSSLEVTLIEKVNALTIELIDARREIEQVTATLNKLLRLMKRERGL